MTTDIKRTDGTGVTDFTYYADDRLYTVDGPLANDAITYQYDQLGRLTSVTPQAGQALTYGYDALGRLDTIQNSASTFTYAYYGPGPLIQRLTRPNGSYTEYEYNEPLKRLTALINKASTGSLINSFAYAYDKDLIKTETVTNGTIIDNFLEKSTSYVPNAVNQLVSATTAPDPAKVYAYDADGNMTTGYTPEGYVLTMTYDAKNRMKTAAYNDGTDHLFQYSYAGNSLLAEVIKDGSTTKYLRSGFLPIQERDGSNSIMREYTWGKNLGGGIGGLLNLKQGGQDYSYLYDGKGNVSALIDSTQAVVASYAYDPFGKLMKKSGSLDQPYTFSTKQAQPGTGLVGFGYRTYDSCSGKWTTRDPLGEAGGMNLYGAVGNNPANFVDPWGLYERNVHYDLTYQLAMEAGFTVRDAMAIAKGNQDTDDFFFDSWKWFFGGIQKHFMSYGCAITNLDEALRYNSLWYFGQSLHILQDTYSHAGYKWYEGGHLRDWTKPDIFNINSERDRAMINMTWLYLLRYKDRFYPSIRSAR